MHTLPNTIVRKYIAPMTHPESDEVAMYTLTPNAPVREWSSPVAPRTTYRVRYRLTDRSPWHTTRSRWASWWAAHVAATRLCERAVYEAQVGGPYGTAS